MMHPVFGEWEVTGCQASPGPYPGQLSYRQADAGEAQHIQVFIRLS